MVSNFPVFTLILPFVKLSFSLSLWRWPKFVSSGILFLSLLEKHRPVLINEVIRMRWGFRLLVPPLLFWNFVTFVVFFFLVGEWGGGGQNVSIKVWTAFLMDSILNKDLQAYLFKGDFISWIAANLLAIPKWRFW